MNFKTKTFSILLVFILLCSFTACSSNNHSDLFPRVKTKWHQSKNDGVIFFARTDKERYTAGETIELYYKIENKRKNDILQQLPDVNDFYVKTMSIRKDKYVVSRNTEGFALAESRPTIKSKEIFEKDKFHVFNTTNVYLLDTEKEEYITVEKLPAGKYTVTLEIEYADVSKLEVDETSYDKGYSRESYKRELETQTLQFEIILTDAPTTTAK